MPGGPLPVPRGATPEPAVFDASVLGDMFGNDDGVVAAVLETFLGSMAASLAELRTAMDNRDLVAMAALAHRIKGAARLSGALALGMEAFALEQLARCGDWGEVKARAARLELQWQLVRDHPALQAGGGGARVKNA